MSRWKGLRAWLRGVSQRAAAERDVSDEMAFHLAMEAEKNERLGMTALEARRRALVAFGGTDRFREAHRDGRSVGWLEDLVRDLRFGLRGYVRAPLFALTAVLTLGLAIGACATVFSMVNGMVLRPFPVPDADMLVALWGEERGEWPTEVGWDDYVDWRESGIFADIAAVRMAPLSLGVATESDAPADLVWSELVTPNYFSVLALRPVAGRFFTAAETTRGSEPRVVISNDYWQARFGGASDVIGRRVIVNGTAGTVIGVAPGSFHGVRRFGFWPDAWIALGVSGTESMLQGRGGGSFLTIARLMPGSTREATQAAAQVFAARLARAYPATNADLGAVLTSARAPFDNPRYVPPRVLSLASVLALFAVGLVLLVACANVANLMLARASAREREISIRLAIGGSRARLIRQLLAESSLLALGGALLGGTLSLATGPLTAALVPQLQFRVGIDTTMDQRVLLFTSAIAIASVFLFGLAPAIKATRTDVVNGLKGDAGNARRARRLPPLRDVLVGGQLAVSVVLLVAGGLFLRSLTAVRTVDLGLEPEGRVMLTVNPMLSGFDAARTQDYYRAIKRRVAADASIISVSWGYPVPFDTNGRGIDLYVDGVTNNDEDQTVGVAMSVADADFFRTVGTRMLDGRDFAAYDTAGAPRALIVNRALARRFWQHDNVVGRRVRLGGPAGAEAQVVGVVADAVFQTPTQRPPPMAFLPLGQATSEMGMTLIAHTQDSPAATLSRIRGIVRETDPGIAAYGAMTMTRAARNAINVQESAAAIAATLGAIALLLAAIGLYGVVAYTVDRRKREVSIRMALGASRAAVLVMVLRRAARTAFTGVIVGLVLAALIGQLLASFLFQVTPLDPAAFVLVSITLVGVVLLASYIPARRAARVDPIVTLRSD